MKHKPLLLGIASALLLATVSCSMTGAPPAPATPSAKPVIDPQVSNCNITPPTTAITPALLTSGLPCAATIVAPFTLDGIQHGFDYYSWLTFLSLNAPGGGKPIGQGPGKGGDGPAEWEGWKEIFEIMLPDGQTPNAWDHPRVVPAACKGLSDNPNIKVARMVGKTPDVLNEVVQPFDTGPLIDQNGRYARYEILVNKPMFEYILQNNLYSKKGQAAFTSTVQFPEGNVSSGTTGTVGAIMVKAAWKVIGQGDDPTAFHTADALVYTPPSAEPKIAESCHKGTLGLVGLHVGHKTKSDPQWIWSTYEHVKNVPTQDDVNAKRLQASYNFYKTGCSAQACPVNVPPPRPWNPNVEPFANGFASQVTRVIPITDEVNKLNAGFGSLLKGTVWQNYMLVSTQWPTDATSKTDPTGAPAPTFLANTTMETYIQGRVPQASSNCIACHNNAAATSGRTSDFTYILERAK